MYCCREELRHFLYFVSNMFSSDKKKRLLSIVFLFLINFIQFYNQAYSHGMFQIVTCTKPKLKGNSTKETSIKKNFKIYTFTYVSIFFYF